jgi:hypothetical protein
MVLAGLVAMVMPFLQAGRKRATLPGTEESMTTLDFITDLFSLLSGETGCIYAAKGMS